MTQYDAIGQEYALIKTLPFARIERENFQAAVEPFVKDGGARVLDLACGIGYYSNHLLTWGASYVMGVDVSEAMAEGAKVNLKKWGDEGRFEARVGNGLKPENYYYGTKDGDGDRKFDVAIGVWFLNYAESSEELAKMFETISMNLKDDDGVFVGITPHPTEDVKGFGEDCRGMKHALGVGVEYTHELENGEGWRTHVSATGRGETEGKSLDFDNYHLKKSVYEEAARRGGMMGKVEWKELRLPDSEEEKQWYGVGEEQWEFARRVPYFGLFVIKKS